MRLPTRLLLGALALSRFTLAQNNDVKGNSDAQNSTTPHVREGDHVVHFVTVGKAANNFYPNSIIASPGDVVMFQFYPSNHSVIRSAYGYPCVPYEVWGLPGDSFYSGFYPVKTISDNPPSWNLTINDTQPIFYYCGAPGSCTGWGMVGGINLNASTPLSNQIGLAREADYMLLPGQPFPNEAQQASMASLAATATTATFTITETPESKSTGSSYPNSPTQPYNESDEHHGLSTGATAGIAVGSAVVALAAVGLIWLMLRTRSLKKRLDAQQTAQNQQPDPRSPMQYGQPGPWPAHQNRQMSQLPPYQSHDVGGGMYKHPDSENYTVSDVPSREMSPGQQMSPYNMQGQFVGFQPGDPRQHRYTTNSELSGSVGPMVELDAPPQHMPDNGGRYP